MALISLRMQRQVMESDMYFSCQFKNCTPVITVQGHSCQYVRTGI